MQQFYYKINNESKALFYYSLLNEKYKINQQEQNN